MQEIAELRHCPVRWMNRLLMLSSYFVCIEAYNRERRMLMIKIIVAMFIKCAEAEE